MGPSFIFVIVGTAGIWIFSFIDLVMINKNFNITDNTQKEAEIVENPYSEDVKDSETTKEPENETPEEPPVYEKESEVAVKDAEL